MRAPARHRIARPSPDALLALEKATPLQDHIKVQFALLERSLAHVASYRERRGTHEAAWPRTLPGSGRQVLVRQVVHGDTAVCVLAGEDGLLRQVDLPAAIRNTMPDEQIAAAATVRGIWTSTTPLPDVPDRALFGYLRSTRIVVQRFQAEIETLRSAGADALAERLERQWFPSMAERRAAGRAVPALPHDEEWEAMVETLGFPGIQAVGVKVLGAVELDRVVHEAHLMARQDLEELGADIALPLPPQMVGRGSRPARTPAALPTLGRPDSSSVTRALDAVVPAVETPSVPTRPTPVPSVTR